MYVQRYHKRFERVTGDEPVRTCKGTASESVAVAKWELGKTEPTASALVSISKFFGVSTDYLLELEDEFGNKI